ncbi:MAG: aspartate aminotransferase family protein [Lentisphaeria bacterium]|nr:aspartate aminotransferase family protein [Lentisphaeria bacterium]
MRADAHHLLDLKQRYTVPCLYHFYRDPPVFERGEMQYLFDTTGKRYLDVYSGVTVMNCGHSNPAIIEPAIDQLRRLQHTTTIYLTEPIYHLAERLVQFLDCSLKRVFFVNSGSEANEGALLLAKLHTGRSGFLSLRGGLHGRTSLTMGLTGIPMWCTDTSPPPGLLQAPRPHCAACDLGHTFDTCGYACVDAVRDLLAESGDIAAVIAEPIQGNGGVIEPPPGYLARLRDVAHEAGALLILDEVQCGFCRTGNRFAFQHEGVEPDILTVAKALGNGFPIAAFCATENVAACYTRPGASTTGGNALSATAALQVLEYMEKRKLDERARELGGFLKNGLQTLVDAISIGQEVRGRGLMLGMELARDGKPLMKTTDWILEEMKELGYLLGKTGLDRNVLTFMPPLVVEREDLERLLGDLRNVLARADGLELDA